MSTELLAIDAYDARMLRFMCAEQAKLLHQTFFEVGADVAATEQHIRFLKSDTQVHTNPNPFILALKNLM